MFNLKTNFRFYEEMSVAELTKKTRLGNLIVIIFFMAFSIFSIISTLFAYSVDPVLALACFAFFIGQLFLTFIFYFIYMRNVLLLKFLHDVDNEDESDEIKV